MTFKRFSEYLDKIDRTASRNEMTERLVNLLRETDNQEIEKTVYLALGGIAPLYKAVNFNLADRMMVRAIARAFNKEVAEVQKDYKNVGDLGEVAVIARNGVRLPRPATGLPPVERAGAMTINQVFDCLSAIANESGQDSQERKLNKTAELLKKLDPLSAKYAVRIILGKLRLGFSDKTILDALSFMIAGDKSSRKEIEFAYNVRPDVGWLAAEIKSAQTPHIPQIPQLGTPVIPALCQRLPTTEEIIEKMSKVAVEPKYDGQRIQAHVSQKIHLFTRSLEDVTSMFPDLTDALSVTLKSRDEESSFILDGEAVGIDPQTGRILSFQTMITRKRKYGIAENLIKVPIRYMVFDILELNGKSLLNEPFCERRKVLERIFRHPERSEGSSSPRSTRVEAGASDTNNLDRPQRPRFFGETPQNDEKTFQNDVLNLAPQIVTSDPTEIRKYLKEQIDKGLEGIVAKKWDSPYSPGRTGFHWVKLKWEGEAKSGGLLDTVDGVVMGIYGGKGKRSSFGIGAFLIGVFCPPKSPNSPRSPTSYKTISKIGTGLSDEQWRQLKVKSEKLIVKEKPEEYDVPKSLLPDVWMRPELVVEVQADNITNSPLHTAGYALRFPRLVRYRGDKKAEQATTKEEIEKLYEMQ